MEDVVEQEIRGERIVIGRRRYVRCTFTDCQIIFDGTAHEDVGCRYINSKISIEGAAVETVRFLHGVWAGDGWHVVEEIGIAYTGKPLRFG